MDWEEILDQLPLINYKIQIEPCNDIICTGTFGGSDYVIGHLFDHNVQMPFYVLEISYPTPSSQYLVDQLDDVLGESFNSYKNPQCWIYAWRSKYKGLIISSFERLVGTKDFNQALDVSGLNECERGIVREILAKSEMKTGHIRSIAVSQFMPFDLSAADAEKILDTILGIANLAQTIYDLQTAGNSEHQARSGQN